MAIAGGNLFPNCPVINKGRLTVAKDNFYNDIFTRLYGKPVEPPTGNLSALLALYEKPAPPSSLATTLTQLMALTPPPKAEDNLGNLSALSRLFGSAAPQPTAPAPNGLWFKDRYFSEPSAFSSAYIPKLSGLYAILVFDLACSPRPYRVLYFGKASDLADRAVRSHEKYDEWCRAAGSAGKLLIAYHIMSDASEWELYSAEDILIKHYQPVCNIKSNPFYGF